ncbi:S16 family serine protease [Kitasatospora terrestris]|uniref:Lon proteolytic domain-containing protein n=1 Tax=Kitasatospora terrestris TaxID=258051 RepID=A0ABP9DN30_9ACTN
MSAQKLPAFLTAPKTRALALCSLAVCVLLLVGAFVPLPFTLTQPGVTVDTLGEYQGKQVITISGAPVRTTTGQLRATTISATNPDQKLSLRRALEAWANEDEALRPTDQVYPESDPADAQEETQRQMTESQDAATLAALGYLHLSPSQVKVTVNLGDIGGPSAGQMIALGIIDKLAGDGKGGDLTGGTVVAGTGTVDADGRIGAVGGVPLKTLAAARDGATVFLVPLGECAEARVNTPEGLRLVPVETLADSVAALTALHSGSGTVPHC